MPAFAKASNFGRHSRLRPTKSADKAGCWFEYNFNAFENFVHSRFKTKKVKRFDYILIIKINLFSTSLMSHTSRLTPTSSTTPSPFQNRDG